MTSKYEPLEKHLKAQMEDIDRITLTFTQIEQIIGAHLPISALKRREWWANQTDTDNRPQAAAWRNAGFKVCELHQTGNRRVTFERRTRKPPR